MGKKAVIFDMDGVIFDTERVYLEIWQSVFEKYGYKMTKELYITVMGTGRKNVIKTFLENFGDDLPIEKMYEEKDNQLFYIIENQGIPLKKGVKELFSMLKEKNYKIALATSAKRDRVEKQIKDKWLKESFDAIVCGDDVEKGKPSPDIFLKAAKEIDVEAKDCFVVEDSPAGIKAAFSGGMKGIHVEDLKVADEDILKYCQKSFKDLQEVKKYLSYK
ncbi:MAG: HAD family hydrolase [Clostridium sp.]|uniref:HAD family hydrolase n=1 Tax=Clostridium sp. TaxID=1506 RepID=UPI002671E2A1|nr:HAD family phosphatase [Clostridium sp.]MCI7030917.1 HAD family phosphatase [Clostridium sp.]